MDDWISVLSACHRRSEGAVVVTVAAARGSVPRDPGTRMVLTATHQHGTIGGGHLELQAVGIAREMLAREMLAGEMLAGETLARDMSAKEGVGEPALRRFALGAALGQCCGGLVNLLFEPVMPAPATACWLEEVARCRAGGEACMLVSGAGRSPPSGPLVVTAHRCQGTLGDFRTDRAARSQAEAFLAARTSARLVSLVAGGPLFLFDPVRAPAMEIVLFGAGHVGQALARILGELPCRVTWIDERAERFPDRPPGNIRVLVSDSPTDGVATAPPGCCFLVMTHSHPLDQALAEAILRRDDFLYFGLIGSIAKRRRFEHRLAARGIGADVLARMTCPIGIAGIVGKSPEVIAVAVAAELLSLEGRVARQGGSPSEETG